MSKPYDFIPFLKTAPHKTLNTGQKLKGKIDLRIEVLNAIHVSMTEYDMDSSGTLYKEFFKINNKYAIPGTSVKGMLRSISEMISNSCISVSKEESSLLPSYKHKTCRGRNLCIICDMFGAMGKKSKIKVSDFICEKGTGNKVVIGMPQLRYPKIGQVYIDDKNILKGYKYYKHGIESIMKKGNSNCECFIKGSVFNGYIIYENLDEDELNLLCYSLGLTDGFNHKIGYGKPSYYGSIRITTENEEYIKHAESYKENSPIEIKNNIDILEKVYSYKNANKHADYDELSY